MRLDELQPSRLVVSEKGDESSREEPFIIGICGGSASGKTTLCDYISKRLGIETVANLPFDSYYKELEDSQKLLVDKSEYDLDAPGAIDFEQLRIDLRALKNGQDINIPSYDFITHSRREDMISFPQREVIIVDGILIFTDPKLRDMFDLKVFVECDNDVRLARRITRDIEQRGRDLMGVIKHYFSFVKPCFDTWVDPSRRFADIVIPNAGTDLNPVAVDVLCKHITAQLSKRQVHKER
jgi:uridine kinase